MEHKEEKIREAFENKNWSEMRAQDSWQLFKIMGEFVHAFEKLGRIGPCVTLFGSARTKPAKTGQTTCFFVLGSGLDSSCWIRPAATDSIKHAGSPASGQCPANKS